MTNDSLIGKLRAKSDGLGDSGYVAMSDIIDIIRQHEAEEIAGAIVSQITNERMCIQGRWWVPVDSYKQANTAAPDVVMKALGCAKMELPHVNPQYQLLYGYGAEQYTAIQAVEQAIAAMGGEGGLVVTRPGNKTCLNTEPSSLSPASDQQSEISDTDKAVRDIAEELARRDRNQYPNATTMPSVEYYEEKAREMMGLVVPYVRPYLAKHKPVSIEAAAEAAHNNYWADEYKDASEIEKAAARQQAVAIAKVWGLPYVD